jgi:hypothetical protein
MPLKNLDSYKFNLLYNKQLFIDQLKTNNLTKRTIDEGSMDEKSGMNFSEYVAILSGNTDLLDKAKLEKQIAGLESEKQAFNRSKSSAKFKVGLYGNVAKHSIPFEPDEYRLGKLTATPAKAFGRYNRKPCAVDGLPPNANPKQIGAKLNEIANKARTAGDYREIGNLYGFNYWLKQNFQRIIQHSKGSTDFL